MVKKTGNRYNKGKCCICGIRTVHSLQLIGRPLCHDCEAALTSIDCDSPRYTEAIDKLKSLWNNRTTICNKGKVTR